MARGAAASTAAAPHFTGTKGMKTAQEGERASAAMASRGGRMVPRILPSIQRMSEDNPVFVFNVGPWGHTRWLGSLGRFFIPACQEGQPKAWERDERGLWVPSDFVEDPATEAALMRPLDGIVAEPLPVDEKQMMWGQDEGVFVAEQILGIGKMHAKPNSLVRRGCFISASAEPKSAEMEVARDELKKFMKEKVSEARSAYNAGSRQAEAIIKPELHHVCARFLHLDDEPWMVQANPEMRQKCENCSTLCDVKAVSCNCGYVFDMDKFAAISKRMVAKRAN